MNPSRLRQTLRGLGIALVLFGILDFLGGWGWLTGGLAIGLGSTLVDSFKSEVSLRAKATARAHGGGDAGCKGCCCQPWQVKSIAIATIVAAILDFCGHTAALALEGKRVLPTIQAASINYGSCSNSGYGGGGSNTYYLYCVDGDYNNNNANPSACSRNCNDATYFSSCLDYFLANGPYTSSSYCYYSGNNNFYRGLYRYLGTVWLLTLLCSIIIVILASTALFYFQRLRLSLAKGSLEREYLKEGCCISRLHLLAQPGGPLYSTVFVSPQPAWNVSPVAMQMQGGWPSFSQAQAQQVWQSYPQAAQAQSYPQVQAQQQSSAPVPHAAFDAMMMAAMFPVHAQPQQQQLQSQQQQQQQLQSQQQQLQLPQQLQQQQQQQAWVGIPSGVGIPIIPT